MSVFWRQISVYFSFGFSGSSRLRQNGKFLPCLLCGKITFWPFNLPRQLTVDKDGMKPDTSLGVPHPEEPGMRAKSFCPGGRRRRREEAALWGRPSPAPLSPGLPSSPSPRGLPCPTGALTPNGDHSHLNQRTNVLCQLTWWWQPCGGPPAPTPQLPSCKLPRGMGDAETEEQRWGPSLATFGACPVLLPWASV